MIVPITLMTSKYLIRFDVFDALLSAHQYLLVRLASLVSGYSNSNLTESQGAGIIIVAFIRRRFLCGLLRVRIRAKQLLTCED